MSPPPDEHEEPFDLLEPLDERSGPARPISAERASALVRGALAGALPPPPAAAPKPWFIAHGAWVVGAAVVVGAVAAGVWWTRQPPPRTEPPPQEAEAPPAPPAPVAPSQPSSPPPAVAPVAEAPPVPAAPVAKTPARPTAEPEDLLRRANERRAEGQWQAAESLYLRVIQTSPGTESAYVALVASGGLRVEQLGDAKGALRQYQQALRLRPRGALSEEAHYGVAKGWRALGDTAQEARALEDFLAAHPDSLRAASAKERLRQLAPPSPGRENRNP